MRKLIYFLIAILIALLFISWLSWINKTGLASHFLSSHLHVPTSIQSLEITKTAISLDRLWIGNPPRSKTSTSFSAQTIDIESNLKKVLSNPLIIESIDIANIFVGVEYYKNGKTNWDTILNTKSKKSENKGKGYLIKTLILRNLTVEVTQANGETKRYPTIAQMEFHNISSDTGIPIKEIEKAIFKLMMQDIFKKLNLFQNLPGSSPLQYLPNFF